VIVRFWATVVIFHAILFAVTWWVARRLVRQAAIPAGRWLTAVGRGALLLGLAAALTGAVTSRWAPEPGFTMLRLWCQGLFGEGVALSAWLAVHLARRGYLRRAVLPAAVTLGLLAAYAQAYHREPRQLQVRRHELHLAASGTPPRRLRILHLTDIQAATIGDHEARALRAGLLERPDLILFTGDYIHERLGAHTAVEAARDFRELMRTLRVNAPLGVYATEGDVGFDCDSTFAGLPVRCLVNACVSVTRADGSRVSLAGLASRTSRGRQAKVTSAVAAACPPSDVGLVMGHSPDFVANLVGERVSLALAGHTHGGQVVIPLVGPPLTLSRLPRRFAADLNDYQGIPLHVSRGVGMERGTAPQIRFLCPPEICIIDVWY
jgi:predicted MPP superfamily phosphohydrolase